jgi:isopentenyl-diphosphate delta-isomerase
VELVDDGGGAVGEATVADAHRAPGRLHRAFSVVLVDDDGRLLLQQRAAVKTRFALRWANACCGHPAPGETVTDAAARRLAEELGVTTVPLREVGVYVYQASDPDTGRVEFEYDHVLVGRFAASSALDLDPAEVAAVEWVTADGLAAQLTQFPDLYAPWLAGVVSAWRGSTA